MGDIVAVFNDRVSGYLAILYPVAECELSIDELAKRDIPSDIEYLLLDKTSLPQVGELFDALVIKNHQITIDTDRSETIIKNNWRRQRKGILERYDLLFMRAVETGNTEALEDIARKKQMLRDVTAIPIVQKEDDDTIETYAQKILNTWPDCLTW
jgi:hypothetical protein